MTLRKFSTSDERSRYKGALSLRLAPQILGFCARRRLELSMRRFELDELEALLPGVIIALDVLQDLGLVELPLDLPDSSERQI